ncbi:MAG: DNA-3-methyladenine glycosylase I [Anaerolineaceae bacterium]
MTTYCEYVSQRPDDAFNRIYHDTQYGFPLRDDSALFERLMLEINQAGLSWITILKKADAFNAAFDGFDIDRVAAYSDSDRARLLNDAGIIRNRLKINAAIENARRIQSLRGEYGSLYGWLEAHHPRPLEEWVKLFKSVFVFTGGEIVKEFLISSAYLPGAHTPDCPAYQKIINQKPAWMISK